MFFVCLPNAPLQSPASKQEESKRSNATLSVTGGNPQLTHLGISIYGHDEASFVNFSKGTSNSFKILKKNLEFFYKLLKERNFNFKIEIGHRTSKDFNIMESDNELSKILKKISNLENVLYDKNHSFNNWGGMIKQEDVKDLNVKFQKELVPKTGSCSLNDLFEP